MITHIDPPKTASPLANGGLADGYGFCFEFAEKNFPDFFRLMNNLQFHQHPELMHRPGVYSDDTQMQMALAELILSGRDWTPLEIATRFVDVFKRDPRPGYSSGMYSLLNRVTSGKEFIDQVQPPFRESNGAAMRSPIIGLYPNLDQVIEYSTIQARLTHDLPNCIDSSVGASLMAHYFAYDLGGKDELPAFLTRYVPTQDWHTPWQGRVGCHGMSTVKASLTAILKTDSLADLLVECVAFTGDVDSVATIALTAASLCPKMEQNIPQNLWDGMERTEFGIEYLLNLDRRLLSLMPLINR